MILYTAYSIAIANYTLIIRLQSDLWSENSIPRDPFFFQTIFLISSRFGQAWECGVFTFRV